MSKLSAVIGSLKDPVVIDDSDDEADAKVAAASKPAEQVVPTKASISTSSLSMSPNSQMRSIRAESKRRWQQKALDTADDVKSDANTSVVKKPRIEEQQQSDDHTDVPIKIFTTELPRQTSSPLTAKHCRSLRQLIGLEGPEELKSTIGWMVIFNYIIDFDYLLDTIPELVSIPNVTVFYGSGSGSPHYWKQMNPQIHLQQLVPSDPPNSATNPLGFKIHYGVHHTKMFLVGLADGTLRVIIHTANLMHSDVSLKTQGAYVQDFPLKTTKSLSCEFETDMVAYLRTYKYNQPRNWSTTGEVRSLRDEIQRYDFTSAKVVLIPSTPGRNNLDNPKGYVKLSQAIRKHVPKRDTPKPIVCQFSSIGSLSVKWLQEIAKSWDTARSDCNKEDLQHRLKLVYPTVDEIRDSVEGYRGGGSVPGNRKNTSKDCLRPLYHKWSSSESNPLHKPHNVPHIKTFYQLTDNETSMEWFCLTSHNLSKAAWGETINTDQGRLIFTRHWELGVFVVPQLFRKDCKLVPAGSRSGDNQIAVPMPFQLNPTKYGLTDHPWAVDGIYSQADRFGRKGCM